MLPARILDHLALRLARELAPPSETLLVLRAGEHAFGRVNAARAARLAGFDRTFVHTGDGLALRPELDNEARRSAALESVARRLAEEGALTAWRDERYAVGSRDGAVELFTLERAAARYFGVRTRAIHVNGATQANGAAMMWIARRSATKSIDPGMLDNMVGGGVAAGLSAADVLVKEAWEEAGLSPALASTARAVSELHVFRAQPDGIQDEVILAHDLVLPDGFVPVNQDGEVAGFQAAPVQRMAACAAGLDAEYAATADASLVIADWLLRHDHLPRDSEVARLVRRSRLARG